MATPSASRPTAESSSCPTFDSGRTGMPGGIQDHKIRWGEMLPHLLPLIRPFRAGILLATTAMMADALLTALRPWPLKVVVDYVLGSGRSRVPLLGHCLDRASPDRSR